MNRGRSRRGRGRIVAWSAWALSAAMVVAPVTWSGWAPAVAVARADDKAAAQKLMNEGNQAAGDGDYVVALDKFRAAYQLFKSPKILINIGTMLRQLGRNVEAAAVYEQYQRDPGAEPARQQEVARILGEIDALVARIRVQVNRPDATLRLDGREVTGFAAGAVMRVEPGEHTLVANHPSFPPAVETVRVGPREERVVVLKLVPPQERTVVVEKIYTGPQRTIGVILGGVGLAGLAAGGASGVIAAVENHAAAKHCTANVDCDADGVSLGKTAKNAATVSTVALAAGGGLLVTGVVLYFTAPSQPKGDAAASSPAARRSARFGAAFSGDGAALRWEGTF